MIIPGGVYQNYSLKALNTLGLSSIAKFYVEVNSLTDLQSAVTFAQSNKLDIIPLGSGSNVVMDEFLDALVIRLNLKCREVLRRDTNTVRVRAGAGENWHEFVLWTLEKKAYGLENLSLIPGTVGAAPIQNIGAYGSELKDFFVSLEAVNTQTAEVEHFDYHSCYFSYRHSVFKGDKKDQYIITSVTLELNTVWKPNLNHDGLKGIISKEFADLLPSAFEMSQVVCDVRRKKLPDPQKIGNAGSFFKNPEISAGAMSRLKKQYPKIVAYPIGQNWKLAAAWLIENVGMRGVREGHVGTYHEQALALVNFGGATYQDVLFFSDKIQRRVYEKFGVQLEREPRLYSS